MMNPGQERRLRAVEDRIMRLGDADIRRKIRDFDQEFRMSLAAAEEDGGASTPPMPTISNVTVIGCGGLPVPGATIEVFDAAGNPIGTYTTGMGGTASVVIDPVSTDLTASFPAGGYAAHSEFGLDIGEFPYVIGIGADSAHYCVPGCVSPFLRTGTLTDSFGLAPPSGSTASAQFYYHSVPGTTSNNGVIAAGHYDLSYSHTYGSRQLLGGTLCRTVGGVSYPIESGSASGLPGVVFNCLYEATLPVGNCSPKELLYTMPATLLFPGSGVPPVASIFGASQDVLITG